MAEAERIYGAAAGDPDAIVESYIETASRWVGTIAGTIARVRAGGGHGGRGDFGDRAKRDGGAGNEGLLEQPHTSAGRVPTARAFRLYVERLSGGVGARLWVGRQRIESGGAAVEPGVAIDSSFLRE